MLTFHSKIYRLVLCTGNPLSSIGINIHCLCGITSVRTAAALKTGLLHTCKQVAEEASHIMYTKNIFAIDESPWPLSSLEVLLQPNRHILPELGHRYVKCIRHLDAKIHLSTFMEMDLGPDKEPEIAATTLDLKGVCKWYYDTLEAVCSKQLENFPDLQSLTIAVTEHFTSSPSYRCDELFVLKVRMNRRVEDFHLFNPILPIDASPMPNGTWKLLEKIDTEGEETIRTFAKEDPKRLLFLPLRNLQSVFKIEVVQRWGERRIVIVVGKSVETVVPFQRNWTFSSVDQFLTYAGDGLSNFHRKPRELTA